MLLLFQKISQRYDKVFDYPKKDYPFWYNGGFCGNGMKTETSETLCVGGFRTFRMEWGMCALFVLWRGQCDEWDAAVGLALEFDVGCCSAESSSVGLGAVVVEEVALALEVYRAAVDGEGVGRGACYLAFVVPGAVDAL